MRTLSTYRILLLLPLMAAVLVACGGEDQSTVAAANTTAPANTPTNIPTSSTPTSSSPSVNVAPTIAGTPPASVTAGQAYSFTPSANDANGNTLTFTIRNRPAWASFNTASGALTGTPTVAQVGSYGNIIITVSDGTASAPLPAFSINVLQPAAATGSATLSWTAPTQNTDGSALTNLAGYRIYYGTNANSLTQTVSINTVGVTTYMVNSLSAGTWYFAIRSYNAMGVESDLSNMASKTI